MVSVSNFFVSLANGGALTAGTDYVLIPGPPPSLTFNRVLPFSSLGYEPAKSFFVTFDARYKTAGPSCSLGNRVDVTAFYESSTSTVNLNANNISSSVVGTTSPLVVVGNITTVPANDQLIEGKPFSLRSCYSWTGDLVNPVFTISSANTTVTLVNVVPAPGFGGSLVVSGAVNSLNASTFVPTFQGGNLVLVSRNNTTIFSNGNGSPAWQLCFLATYVTNQPLNVSSQLTWGNSNCQPPPPPLTFSAVPVVYNMSVTLAGPGSCVLPNKTYTMTINAPNPVPGSPYQPV